MVLEFSNINLLFILFQQVPELWCFIWNESIMEQE